MHARKPRQENTSVAVPSKGATPEAQVKLLEDCIVNILARPFKALSIDETNECRPSGQVVNNLTCLSWRWFKSSSAVNCSSGCASRGGGGGDCGLCSWALLYLDIRNTIVIPIVPLSSTPSTCRSFIIFSPPFIVHIRLCATLFHSPIYFENVQESSAPMMDKPCICAPSCLQD